MSIDTDNRPTRRTQQQSERREIAYYVRAKTGSGPRDWSAVGVAFRRRNNQDCFTVKLNTLPIDMEAFKGALVLVPPLTSEDEAIDE